MESTSNEPASKLAQLRYILTIPFGCLFSSPLVFFSALAMAALLCGYIYFYVNVDFLGLGAPDFQHLVIDSNFEQVQGPAQTWTVTYEFPDDSTFSGKVSHVSPLREPLVPFLTHDILITSGDYSEQDKVNTSVHNHHFSWKPMIQNPQGTINLLHTVPFNEAIYRQLLRIRTGQVVSISGREILKIDAYNMNSQLLGTWTDAGCNSIVVTGVKLEQP